MRGPHREATSSSIGITLPLTTARMASHPGQAATLSGVSPQYFAVLGVPLLAGRDFAESDRSSGEHVAIVNQSVARRLFPSGDALNRRLTPTNLGTNLTRLEPSRIIGIVADVDEENVVQEPSMIVYYPLGGGGSRLFVRAAGDPRALIPSVTRTIHQIAADQAVASGA